MEYTVYKSFPRPRKFLGPIFGTVPLMFALIGVARASGSGWVQVVGAIVSSLIFLGIVAPMIISLTNKLYIIGVPHFLIANSLNAITIKSQKTCRITTDHGNVEFLSPKTPSPIQFTPHYMGRLSELSVIVSTAAPFGIVWWYRKIVFKFDHEILVLPPASKPDYVFSLMKNDSENQWRLNTRGEIRGSRDYVSGDSLRSANWKTTAHVGKLQIKEFEVTSSQIYSVYANFYGTLDEIESRAEQIMGTVEYLLKIHPFGIILITLVNLKPFSQEILTSMQAQIQLAQADKTIISNSITETSDGS